MTCPRITNSVIAFKCCKLAYYYRISPHQASTSDCLVLGSPVCLRGICQDESGAVNSDQYCYSSTGSTCGTDSFCGLPGKRHGFNMLLAVIEGTTEVAVFFGGQTTGFREKQAELSRDVHVISFDSSSANAIKVPIDCEISSCPAPRRDAAAVMMKDGQSNGKLLIFGGMACPVASPGAEPGASCSNNPIKTFLDKNVNSKEAPTALNDLWYLALDGLDDACVKEGYCYTMLSWTKVDVPGAKPANRWGAGLVIDNSDNLFVTVSLCMVVCSSDFNVLQCEYVFFEATCIPLRHLVTL
jgi:hypothetical protein